MIVASNGSICNQQSGIPIKRNPEKKIATTAATLARWEIEKKERERETVSFLANP